LAPVHSLRVGGAGWSQQICIGSLADARDLLRGRFRGQGAALVTDRTLLALHGSVLEDLLPLRPLLVAEGEAGKSWTTLQELVTGLAHLEHRRDLPVLALGGGSVGDVAGLAASLFKRGCPWVYIPTTLLAQVDSAVGGKTAIDCDGQKNLVGSFHPPELVICDPALLDTLDPRQLRAGYAEVVKYGLIDDPAFFGWCEGHGETLLGGDRAAREHAILACMGAKARLVGNDLHDRSGRRALLNLGHSFGHAIEALTGFGPVLHGEAVAVGLVMAARFSERLALLDRREADRLRAHLAAVGLPSSLSDVGLAGRGSELLPLMLQDKKAQGAGPVLILLRGIGRAFIASDISADELGRFLAAAP
jgi:3-dehydroquinate synthase